MAIEDITRLVEEVTGVPPVAPRRSLTKEERKTQAERVKRFLALPPPLQEGILKYGESIRKAYGWPKNLTKIK